MADTGEAHRPAYRNVDSAPHVYFDLVPAFGVMEGAIQIELAGRVISPTDDSGTLIEFVTTARLRCSPAAARQLLESLEKALAMIQQAETAPEGAAIN